MACVVASENFSNGIDSVSKVVNLELQQRRTVSYVAYTESLHFEQMGSLEFSRYQI